MLPSLGAVHTLLHTPGFFMKSTWLDGYKIRCKLDGSPVGKALVSVPLPQPASEYQLLGP